MPIFGWICPLFAAFTVSASLALASVALSAGLPVKPDHAKEQPPSPSRLCTDMAGRKFRWNWPNVPFAAVCYDSEEELKTSPPSRQPPQ